MLSLSVCNPYASSWATWAGAVVQSTADEYNLPNPGVEGSWQTWATELLLNPALSELGLPDPRAFGSDWRGWAVAFTQVAV